MAYRFTNTEKWNDTWFCSLKLAHKAMYLYLCDQCDIAGFLEINLRKFAFDLGIKKQDVEAALTAVESKVVYSSDGRFLYLRNFLKHQKNLPLNELNKAHKAILKRMNEMSYLFDIKDIDSFIHPPSIPLARGLGNGEGNGKNEDREKEGVGEKEKETWHTDFEVYLSELRRAYKLLLTSKRYIAERQEFHPELNIELTLKKACKDYWATERGWKHKKQGRGTTIDWKQTFNNALNQKQNHVYIKR